MDELTKSMEELLEDDVLRITEELVARSVDGYSVIESLNKGMVLVGKKFEEGDYFLADLIYSGLIYCNALDIVNFSPSDEAPAKAGTVMIGVVEEDIHTIGKDIIMTTLRSDGYDVIDLGTDVSSETFVEQAEAHRPDVIALCGTMSFALEKMEATIKALNDAGVGEFSKVIIGGYPANQDIAHRIGADAYARGPLEVLSVFQELLQRDE